MTPLVNPEKNHDIPIPGESGSIVQAVARVSRLLLTGKEVEIDALLGILGEAVGVNRCYIFQFRDEGRRMDNTWEWCSPGTEPQKPNLQNLDTFAAAWTMRTLRANREVVVPDVDGIPEEGAFDREFVAAQSIKAYLLAPIYFAGGLKGFVGFDDTQRPHQWTADDVLLLRTAADLINAYFQRRQAEVALYKEREQLLALFESIEFPIWVADPETYEILYMNTEARGAQGPLPGCLCYEVLQKRQAPCPFCNNETLLADPHRPVRWEFHNPVTDKDYIIYNRIIRWPDGRNVRFELDVDITELNRGREALLRAEKLESLSVLAGGIAHDFNNLLTGVLGNISLARELAAEGADPANLLEETERAAVQARELTGQLLTFAKGSPSRPREIADLHTIVKEAATFTLRGSKVGCRIAPTPKTYTVSVDSGQITQAVQNIVLNAAQSMEQGGLIDITFRDTIFQEESHPVLSAGRYVVLEIADRGPGIPRHLAERIFDPFFTTREGGSGLGLTTAYSIAVQHEGTLELSPRQGGGTIARFTLPLVEEPVAFRSVETRPARGTGARILLMDDEDIVRKTALSMLKALGYEPIGVADGEEAIRQFNEAIDAGHPFAAVILDLTVSGGLGGSETLDRLLEIEPNVRAVASSGYSVETVATGTKPSRFSGFLPKPYSLSEIGRVIGKLLAAESSGAGP